MASEVEKRETRRLPKVERRCRVGGSIARCRIGTWREARNAIVGRIVATFQRDPGPLPFALYAIPDFSRVLPFFVRPARRGYGWKGGWREREEDNWADMAKDGIMIDEIACLVLGGKRCFLLLLFFIRRRDSFKDLKGVEAWIDCKISGIRFFFV